MCAGNPSGDSCTIKINLSGAMRRKAAAEKSAAAVSGSKEKHSSPERKGRVCAGNPSGDSYNIKINIFETVIRKD